MRIGHGYDVHRLVEDRELILGGVNIPFEKGLLGHSDADVLTHALMDAMLGAAGLGDIGKHFPDTDPQYKGADSLALLAYVRDLLQKNGYHLINADITLIAQRPKVASYLPLMKEKLAQTLQCDLSQLNIKATTEEHLGFTGEGAGMACHAVCLIDH
ncbi:MAG: 2-C-methyl-D-erythritol 2,4-cyclodiphosphate synthase [Clostridia bacterium]|nr:2-C-methyl-D-erythritol 2,4-cyclodiphosphate synthase [Clostridia bacterium]